ncbi:MAG: GNAT family N-acetyltransferase [Myxococcota bacterium]
MESFRIDGTAGRSFSLTITEATEISEELVRTLIEIDLQTFSESTFSHYTARAFLRNGRVFLLSADGRVIGTCVCMRAWDRPGEAMILSMGIRPGWRGRGVGHRFVQAILLRLSAKGLRSVSLMVSLDNRRAIRVYEESGFSLDEVMERDSRTGEAFVLMRAHFKEPPLTVV